MSTTSSLRVERVVNVLPQDVQRTLVSVSSGCICFKELSSFTEGTFRGPKGPHPHTEKNAPRAAHIPLEPAERGISRTQDNRFQEVRLDSSRNALKRRGTHYCGAEKQGAE